MNESTIYQLVTGLLLPFAGTVVGCATVFFLQRQMGGAAAEGAPGFCRKGNDRGRCLVTSDSRHGNVGGGAAGAFCRHCHTERSGGRHRLSAAVRRRNAEGQGVFVWGGVQRCRAYRALLTILLTSLLTPMLPYLLTFAAGAMIYVVVEELIPEAQAGEHSNIGTIGAALGFALMMVLDVALG